MQNTPPFICMSLNKNNIYCILTSSSKKAAVNANNKGQKWRGILHLCPQIDYSRVFVVGWERWITGG